MTAPHYAKPGLLQIEVEDPTKEFDALINENSFLLSVEPSPELLDLFEDRGFTKRGKNTWSIHIRNDNAANIANFLNNYKRIFSPHTLYSMKSRAQIAPLDNGLIRSNGAPMVMSHNVSSQLYLDNAYGNAYGINSQVLRDISQNAPMFDVYYETDENIVAADSYTEAADKYVAEIINNQDLIGINYELRKELSPVVLYMYEKNSTLYVKMELNATLLGKEAGFLNRTVRDMVQSRVDQTNDLVRNLEGKIHQPVTNSQRARYIVWQEAHNVVETVNNHLLTEHSWDMEISKPAFDLLEQANNAVTVGYATGQPAKALVTQGINVDKIKGWAFRKLEKGQTQDISVSDVLKAQRKNPQINFHIHPSLVDIVNMNEAEDYIDDLRLLSYQKTAVGLHLSTDIGYLNASDPGLGKSMMQLSGMRERAKNIDFYRGLIVCEANVRKQWEEYAEIWFPEAEVFVLQAAKDVDAMTQALASEKPVIVLSSYALAAHILKALEARQAESETVFFGRMTKEEINDYFAEKALEPMTVGDLFADTYWHDICADEAVAIRNNTSAQARAMWELRKNSGVAVALTGTPVNKNPDDMANLLQWIRNDSKLFQGMKLSNTYDYTSLDGAVQMFQDLSPLVFRRERNEVQKELENHTYAGKLPEVPQPKTLVMKPTTEEHSLANAAESELRRIYIELLEALEAVDDNGVSEDELKEAKEQLRDVRGQLLGGTQLARMATSDPAALLESESVGASLLVGQGLVDNALEEVPTKRKLLIERAEQHVNNEESIIVFTEFNVVAELLVKSLEENGIRAGAFTGKNRTTRDRNRKDFQDGKLDVLVLSKAGERGLTLHRAAAVYHYDLPWTVERLVQRMGRAIRVGSYSDKVENFFLILEGTVEERVAEQILKQGTSASMILDASRGVDVGKTGLGNAMTGLLGVRQLADKKGALEFGKALNLHKEKENA